MKLFYYYLWFLFHMKNERVNQTAVGYLLFKAPIELFHNLIQTHALQKAISRANTKAFKFTRLYEQSGRNINQCNLQ